MNYCKITYFLLISFLSFYQPLIGQKKSSDYNFTSIEDGFTQRAITSIYKDADGYLWISTYGDGLFRYNGLDFKNYKKERNAKENSLNSSIVYSALQDVQKNIWVGSELGLNFYNKNNDKFENITLQEEKEEEEEKEKLTFPIHTIAEYDSNTLLLGTHKFGLFKFDKTSFTHKLIPYKINKPSLSLLINTIVKSSNGRFLIGTNHGLMTFDPYNEVLQLAKFNTENGYETIDNSIESLHVAQDNSIWIGTFSSGLFRVNHNNNDVYSIEEFSISRKRILSLAEKKNGNILCGTENDGLFEVNYTSKRIKKYQQDKLKENGIKSNSIWTVFTDAKDRVWLGYYNKGIDLHDDNYNKFSAIISQPYVTNSLNSSSVTGIVKDDDGRFWISMFDGGVDVYDPKKEKFINLYDQKNPIAKGLNILDIPTIFIDSKKNVWIGTWDSGIYFLKYNSKKFVVKNPSKTNSVFKSNRVMSFDEDSKGTIWIGTFGDGLYSYDLFSETFTHYNSLEFQKHDINTSNIRKVLVDHKDAIWIGTRNGVFKIEKDKTGTLKVYSINDLTINTSNLELKESSIIFSLFEDSKNNIWFGTLGYGLAKYTAKNKSLVWYTIDNGLIHETISSISQGINGSLWIGGNKGLSKLDIEKNTFTNFNKKDGLLSNSFNYNAVFRDIDNVLYFGNLKGINYFNPDKIIYNQEKTKVYLSNFKISNEVITPETKNSPLTNVISKTKEIVLNHYQSSFTFEYVGVNYTRGENNQYAYFLEGFDENWNYVETTRSATYKNVPPGDYTFMVKASNNDEIWNDTPRTLEIKILAPWWKTNLALFIFILITLTTVLIIYNFLNARLKERQQIKKEREERAQDEALNAKKIQFFTNISHEFRTPLTLILNPLEAIIENKSVQLPNDISEKHATIYKNSKRLSRLIDELMDFRKLQFNKMSINASKFKIVPFVKEVVSHFEEEAVQRNIILSVESQEENTFIWADPSMLEKIIFNLLSNAFKATKDDGMVSLNIQIPLQPIDFPLLNGKEDFYGIEISILDSGIGINKRDLGHIFTRFYQSNEMDKQYYGGTGIGLEVVKNFIDLHMGIIEVRSEQKKGTEFKILLPLGSSHLNLSKTDSDSKTNDEIYEQINKSEINLETANSKERNKKTVLIVEDNSELRNYLKNELKEEYKVKTANNGKEGLLMAVKFIPDLVISDVMMPIMDGIEMCQEIKNDIRVSHIPLLMLTAKGMQIDRVKGIDSGADVYLNKPYNMDVLKAHLSQLISSRQILFNKYYNGVSDKELRNTTSLDKQFITNILEYIHENITDPALNVENLADKLLISRSKLYRKIKALTGNTANEFIKKIRLEKAKQFLENSDYSISEISYKIGFSSPSYFTKCYKIQFGILPTDVRQTET